MAGVKAVNGSIHLQTMLESPRPRVVPRSIFIILLSFVIGAVFVYAGALKAWDPLTFANDVEHFRMLSWPLGIRLAFYLPWLEILCGLALIAQRWQRGALVILTGLMLAFLSATIAARLRGINLDCGCFGSASKGLGFTSHLLIDLALLAGLLWLARFEWKRVA